MTDKIIKRRHPEYSLGVGSLLMLKKKVMSRMNNLNNRIYFTPPLRMNQSTEIRMQVAQCLQLVAPSSRGRWWLCIS